MSETRKIRIAGTGAYLPRRRITSEELDRELGLSVGSCERSSGVKVRYRADPVKERVSFMAARAAEAALASAKLKFSDVDALVCVSGTPEQAVPYTASLIQREMGFTESGTPAFDVNATCLSFVTGLDHVSYAMDAGRYRRVLFVSTENSSNSIDWKDLETASLFGDGACAVVVERSEAGSARLIASSMETYSSGAYHCRLDAGGSAYHASLINEPKEKERFVFRMDGRRVVKLALDVMPAFVDKLMARAGTALPAIDLTIPHQASRTGMELMRRKLEIPESRWMDILADYGNIISVSIPLALHEAIRLGRLKRGEKVLLLGTSAGFSVGGIVLEY